MKKQAVIGWSLYAAGTALWVYGYFATGNPPLVNWHAISPWWISDFLPNIQSEAGMALCLCGMVPMYWPSRN